MFDLAPEFHRLALATTEEDRSRIGLCSHGRRPGGGDRLLWAIGKVSPLDDAAWIPDPEDGTEAIIVPVRDKGQIIDLLAFRHSNAARWRWRQGNAAILGLDQIDVNWPRFDGAIPTLVATPLDWLASGGAAMCILDWSAKAELRSAFGLLDEIAAPLTIARRLDGILREQVRLPRFRTIEEGARHAA